MPVITVKAKAGRDPAKIDRLIAAIRHSTAEILEVEERRVLVVYEEVSGEIYFASSDAAPNEPPK